MGYEGSGVKSHFTRSAPESVGRGRGGLAGPVVQAAVVPSEVEVSAGYAAAGFVLSTPVSNLLPLSVKSVDPEPLVFCSILCN
jgi:hypothetical protein